MQELTLRQFLLPAPIVPKDIQTTVDLYQQMNIAGTDPKRKWIPKGKVIGEIVNEITVEIPNIVMDRKENSDFCKSTGSQKFREAVDLQKLGCHL